MKKTRFFVSLALILAIAVLAGCGASGSPNDMAATEAASPEYSAPEGGATESQDSASTDGLTLTTGELGSPDSSSIQDKIIYSAEARIETKDYDKAIEDVNALVKELGGYLESSSIGGASYLSRSGRWAEFVIRVPSASFSDFTGRLPDMGNLVYCRSYSQNVTTEYIDVESRLESYRIQEERLLAMLEQATELEDMLVIESHLAEVRYNIESYTSQLNYLDSQVNYSTVTLSVEEVVEYSPDQSETQSFAARMKAAFSGGISGLIELVQDIILFLLYSWYLIVIAVVIVIIVVRRIRKRRAEKKD
jgi:hypothetical protein